MARIKINLPKEFVFETEIKVRLSDINYGGHVGNQNYLTYAQEARTEYFAKFGYTEKNLEGVGSVLGDAAIVYKGEVFYGNTLKIAIAVENYHKYGFDLIYKMTNIETDTVVAVIKTGIICFDYKERKLTQLPEKLRRKLEG